MYLSRVCITFKSLDGEILASGTYHVATKGKTKAEIVAAAMKASENDQFMDDRLSGEVVREADIQFTVNADNPKAVAEELEEWDVSTERFFDLVHGAANVIAEKVKEGDLHGQLTFIRSVYPNYAEVVANWLDGKL